MTLTNEQVASLDETSVLRVVRGHGLLGAEGTLVRHRADHAPLRRDADYTPVQTLDGTRIHGAWFPDRFDLVEPQPITGPLPAGTLLRCIEEDHLGDGVKTGIFYRLLSEFPDDPSFIQVTDLAGEPVKISGGTIPFGFYPRRFVYYPDSAPAEPTTEKGTTMSTTLTREIAASLLVGTVLIHTDNGSRAGQRFTLDRPGIDGDGDFHGTYGESDPYGLYQNWSYFTLPADSTFGGTTTPSDDDWKDKFERLIEALSKEAERREWCPQFDSFMEDNGFEGLCGTLRTFKVHRTATVEWDTTVEARSQEHAERLARDLNVPTYVYEIDDDDRYGDVSNVEVEEVEEA